nr:SET domain-containing protein [Nostoc sp. EkiNYC01]
RAFQDSLRSTTPDVDFLWEAREFPVDKLPEKVLLDNLKVVPSAPDDLYAKGNYPDWPKPQEWPSEWEWRSPVDPISFLKPNGRQCDMCVEATCHCIDLAPRAMPRIKYYGTKGRGLQAVADRPGQIAYQKGEMIGQLLGELAPLDTYDDGWALELARSDHPSRPSVCQIYCKMKGNYFRLLNHDCDSNAAFTGRVISGQFRSIVTAKREIRDGDEITVDYGREYWRGRKCLCDTCRLRESAKEKLRSDNIGSD